MKAEKIHLEGGKALSASMILATIIITFINGPLTIIKELSPLKDSLIAAFGHHWVGHGVILLILFLVLTGLFYPYYNGRDIETRSLTKMAIVLIIAIAFMLIATLGFFVYEFAAE